MAVDHDAHAERGQPRVVAQVGVAVGDQHQRLAELAGDAFQVIEILDADQADGIGTGLS